MQLPSIDRFKQVKTRLNERQALVKEFLDKLNEDRGKYPLLKASRIGMLLAPLKTKELYNFLADCKFASSFSKYFWWSVNPSKHK